MIRFMVQKKEPLGGNPGKVSHTRTKIFLLFAIAAFTINLCGCQSEKAVQHEAATAPAASDIFQFTVLKVGQADAMVLQTKEHCVVIDCGEPDDGDEVVQFLAEHNIPRIDYLFITHFDKDHVGGVPEVIQNSEINQIVTPDYKGEGEEYEDYLAALSQNGITPQTLTENLSFVLDDVLFEVFPPLRSSYAEDDNDFSLCISVTHGERRFLFTGDAESVRLSEIMEQTDGTFDFLKVPHHGKYESNTKKFLERIKPTYAVITDSEKNPAEERVTDALKLAGCETYCTKAGNITVQSDGADIVVRQE